jgi:hypothetical protein
MHLINAQIMHYFIFYRNGIAWPVALAREIGFAMRRPLHATFYCALKYDNIGGGQIKYTLIIIRN